MTIETLVPATGADRQAVGLETPGNIPMPRPRFSIVALLICLASYAVQVRGDESGDLVNKAIAAQNQKRFADAIALYAKALKLIQPNTEAAAIVNHRLGQAEAADGRLVDAE